MILKILRKVTLSLLHRMGKKSTLILQHILKCGVLEPSDADEVLPIFSSDAASTVAVTIVSGFSNEGAFPNLETEFTIDWVMQVVAYCLSLPTLYNEALLNAMTIFRHWITNDKFFVNNQVRNKYIRQIFRYLSQIFEFRFDNTHPSVRKELIGILIDDLDHYQEVVGHDFEDETWEVLVRILIGACDFISNSESSNVLMESSKNVLPYQCFSLLFKVLCNSKLTNLTIWNMFFKFCSVWSGMEDFLMSWHDRMIRIWEQFLDLLYSKSNDIIPIGGETDNHRKELTLCGFQLHQFIHAISFETTASSQEYFKHVAHAVKNLAELCDAKTQSSPALFQPIFPAELFFGLFGEWCFKSFDYEFSTGQTVLVKSLLTIASEWDFPQNSMWMPVLLATVHKALQKGNKQLLISVLNNAHSLLLGFPSPEIISMFAATISTFDLGTSLWLSFWSSFGLLLLDISETRKIPPKVLASFLQRNTVPWPRLNALYILMRDDPSAFCSSVVEMMPSMDDEAVASVLLMVGAAPPFHALSADLSSMLLALLRHVRQRFENQRLLNAFLAAVAQLSRWRREPFEGTLACELADFFADLIDSDISRDFVSGIARLLCGRPLNRSFQPSRKDGGDFCVLTNNSMSNLIDSQNSSEEQQDDKDLEAKPIAAFMVGEDALVTVVGDKERKKDFVLHVRSPSGFFMWRIEDEIPASGWSLGPTVSKLPKPPYTARQPVSSQHASGFAETETLAAQIADVLCDKDYGIPNTAATHSHISVFNGEQFARLRHKAADFLVQTGLAGALRRVEEPLEDLLARFDAVSEAEVVRVPVFRAVESGLAVEESPQLRRFIALLGAPHVIGGEAINAVQFGQLTVGFVPGAMEESDGFVGILFAESPLHLNLESGLIRKHELLVHARPLDARYYRVGSVCGDPRFWNTIAAERIVAAEHISEVIASIVFTYVAAHRAELLLAKNEERAGVLRSARTSVPSPLAVGEGSAVGIYELGAQVAAQ